jgi:hypothetical protein
MGLRQETRGHDERSRTAPLSTTAAALATGGRIWFGAGRSSHLDRRLPERHCGDVSGRVEMAASPRPARLPGRPFLQDSVGRGTENQGHVNHHSSSPDRVQCR